jgi:hypothetical protein
MLWQGNRDVYRARPVAFTRGANPAIQSIKVEVAGAN